MSSDCTGEREMPPSDNGLVDAARRAHLAHEARAVKTLAQDAFEDGIHAARRAVRSARRGIERLEDIRDDGSRCVKRQPLKTVTLAAAVGLAVGLAAGWIAGQRDAHPDSRR